VKLDADQENALLGAAQVAIDLRERFGGNVFVSDEWELQVAATVLTYLGHMTPASWAELRRLTEHTRERLGATGTKADEDVMPW
jgi:hypothetical protein